MGLYRHLQTLLAVTTPTNQAQTGTGYLILPTESLTDESEHDFRAFFDASQTGGATSPTTDVYVQTSHDGINWINVGNMTQLTTTAERHEFISIGNLGPYVRAMSVLAGGTLPSHAATVRLASDRPFRLKVP